MSGEERKAVHCIANAHVDLVWQWTREEGIAAALSTFRSAADLAERNAFVFCHNESFLYEYVEAYEPALFARIKALVASGRWHIMGGWFLQPDCNLPCGESLARQIEEGRRYFSEKFGAVPTVAVNVDPFGHSRGLVQILQRSGFTGYIVGRPSRELLPLPAEQFLWEGFDGSCVAAARIGRYATLMGHAAEHIAQVERDTAEETALAFWGLGNHGGGPSRKDLADIAAAQSAGARWVHSTPERFFADIAPQAVWKAPLTHVFPGCYSSLARIKRLHAALESELYKTEAICALADLRGVYAYPAEELHSALRDLLQLEFHDVLAGTCTKTCEEASLALGAHGMESLRRAFDGAFYALANGSPAAAEGEYPLFVFNPQPYPVRACVEAEFTLCPSNDEENDDSLVFAKDGAGAELPAQVLKEESNLNWDCRKRAAVLCTLAPLGLTRLSLTAQRVDKKERRRRVRPFAGEVVRAAVEPSGGGLIQLSFGGEEVLAGGVAPVLFDDTPDPWAMGEAQREHIGTNARPFLFARRPSGAFAGGSGCRCIESGAVLERTESFFRREQCAVRMEYTFYRALPYVDIAVTVLFNARDRAVKLALPVAFDGAFIGQTAYGVQTLEKGRECAAQRYVAVVRENGMALLLLNRGSYAFSFDGAMLTATLVRGATYCAHPIGERELLPRGRYTEKADQGEHRFFFRLAYARAEDAERLANEFCRAPYALNLFPAGSGGGAPFALTLSDPAVTLSSFRKREDGYLIRLFNPTGKERRVCVRCGQAERSVRLGAYAIGTVLYRDGELFEQDGMLPRGGAGISP